MHSQWNIIIISSPKNNNQYNKNNTKINNSKINKLMI